MVQDFFVIQGLDTLWEAFLRSSNSSVVKDAGEFLTQLHLRLRGASDRTSDVWGRLEGIWFSVFVPVSVSVLSCVDLVLVAFRRPSSAGENQYRYPVLVFCSGLLRLKVATCTYSRATNKIV